MKRLKATAIAFDQLVNALANGAPDETLSSRAHRARAARKPHWRHVADWIDALFFWQRDHCLNAWRAEVERRQLPRTFREP